MVFHFAVFFWSVLFYLGLQVIAQMPLQASWSWYIFTILPLLIVAVLAAQRLTKRTADAFLPSLLAIMTPTLLSLVDNPSERQVFMLMSTGMFYFALLGIYRLRHAPKDKTARAILNTSAMAGLFFFFASIYGFYLNFTFPLWGMMLLFFLGASSTSYVTFQGFAGDNVAQVKLYSIILGLTMAELAWIMSFWPFGYLTTAVISLIFFFIVWDISVDAFHKSLMLKRTAFRTAFFLALVALVVSSSPWRILV